MGTDDSFPDYNDDEQIEEEIHQWVEFESHKTWLKQRCKQDSISFREIKNNWDNSFESYIVIDMPNGPSTRPITLYSSEEISQLLKVDFGSLTFLGQYAACWNKRDEWIEASIVFLNRRSGGRDYSLLFGTGGFAGLAATEKTKPIVVREQDATGGRVVKLGSVTDELIAFASNYDLGVRPLSLRIENIGAIDYNEAVTLLERIADSLFFQIDTKIEVAIGLLRVTHRPQEIYGATWGRTRRPQIHFPDLEFEHEPLSLYWYARSADKMPLLQYLAYYQTLEYFFPRYSRANTLRKIRAILADPLFKADDNASMNKIFVILREHNKYYRTEEDQLKATLHECIDIEELRTFITRTTEMEEHFSKKSNLTSRLLRLNNTKGDIRNDVAQRIYDIRCQIVHTKYDETREDEKSLLPFSKEVQLLAFDIVLINFIVRKVLNSASRTLK